MIGQTLSHFKITAKLGQGGMGEVYRAHDTKLKREVALKVLPSELAGSQERLERFQREAQTLAALDHPNIVTIYSVEQAEGINFLTMQLVEGRTLSELIGAQEMPIEQVVEIAIPICDALGAAHARGVIHRDLKPGNIIVTDDGRVKVLDFGLAKTKQLADEEPDTQLATEPLTADGRILGTMAYMSPEQLGGRDLDARSDIFSLGVVLYEMVTGTRPFKGDTPVSTISATLHDTPALPSTRRSPLPPRLDSIISRCLEKTPNHRFQDVYELRNDLARLHQVPVNANRRLRIVTAAFAVVAAMIAGYLLLSGDGSPSAAPPPVGEELSRGPSIAVLPFTNASGDPEQEYFSDGLTEELITELSRFSELTVVARTSTLEYKDRIADVREVGDSLGVRYVLQGSVQKAGDTIRMTVELSDTTDGTRLWGESYDRTLTASDFFGLQDELTLNVVDEIAGSFGALFQAEFAQVRRKPPANLDSYECILRAIHYLQIHTLENHLASRECLERVVEVDPDYAEAKAWLGYIYGEEYHHRFNARPDEYDALDRALELGEQAVNLDNLNQVTHGTLALTLFLRGNFEGGIVEARRAVDLNPRNALWLALMGLYLAQSGGDYEHGIPMVRDAAELSPHPPTWFSMAFFYDHYFHGRWEEALAETRLMDWDGDFRVPVYVLATLGQLGRDEEAIAAKGDLQRLWTRPNAELRSELLERHAFDPALVELLMEGLAKAGLEGLSS